MSKRSAAAWPERVTVCGVPFRVALADELRGDDDQRLWGWADYRTRKLSLATRLNDGEPVCADALFLALLHEMLHAVLYQEPTLAHCVKGKSEERFVTGLANTLGPALLDTGLVVLPESGSER